MWQFRQPILRPSGGSKPAQAQPPLPRAEEAEREAPAADVGADEGVEARDGIPPSTAELILSFVAEGMSYEELRQVYPEYEEEAMRALVRKELKKAPMFFDY